MQCLNATGNTLSAGPSLFDPHGSVSRAFETTKKATVGIPYPALANTLNRAADPAIVPALQAIATSTLIHLPSSFPVRFECPPWVRPRHLESAPATVASALRLFTKNQS